MKDNSLDGHRGKVALSDTARSAATVTNAISIKCDLKSPANDGSTTTNFDDDYNEWELGIGDLIIDLDADIEKTNEKNNSGILPLQNGTSPPSIETPAFNFLGPQVVCSNSNLAMSNSKSPRSSGVANTAGGAGGVSSNANSNSSNASFEHQATVDKGLKMKIKRKTVGKQHEIVQSDTKSSSSPHTLSENSGTANSNCSNNNTTAANSTASNVDTPKSKHSSSKGRTSSHREKKDKKDKDKSSNSRSNAPPTSTPEVNGGIGVMSPLKITNSSMSLSSTMCSTSSSLPSCNSSVPSPGVQRNAATATSVVVVSPTAANCAPETTTPVISISGQISSSSSPPMPNLTVKLENKFSPSPVSQSNSIPSVVIKADDRASPPLKRFKVDVNDDKIDLEGSDSSIPPEMKDTSTCTTVDVGTITEPDCLGPCEPGTSVMLEGIVWQETDGGVLVVNVTWRGKTYVGTLLDCTKHDWAPPRFCESPTSDGDSKTAKGRGKRGRGGNTSTPEVPATLTETRNCVQSKLRNGKGRRTTINSNASNTGFSVPNSPAKSDSGGSGGKRKKGSAEPEVKESPVDSIKSAKRSRSQKNATPTSSAPVADPSQPSDPSKAEFITCPEPNCSKRYKHINGLKYHTTHAHSGCDSGKIDDANAEDSKDVTNSSDNEESMQESASVSTSPTPSFANTVSNPGKSLLSTENGSSSSSSSLNGLPENDNFSLTTDLTTLAAVAIGDASLTQNSNPLRPESLQSSVSQDISIVSPDEETSAPILSANVSDSPPNSVSISSSLPGSNSGLTDVSGLSSAVSAVTASVIQSSSTLDSSDSHTMSGSIPTPLVFSQGMLGSSSTTPCVYTSSTIVCKNSNPLSPSVNTSNVSPTFSTLATSSSTTLPMIDKSQNKQERLDKYKTNIPSIRPIVPAPSANQYVPLSGNMPPSHSSSGMLSHTGLNQNQTLKPIQPKPSVLGEQSTINPSLENLKKDKSKHKKKSKDRDKKIPSLPLTPTKMGASSNDECEALELTSYPNLEAVPSAMSGTPHAGISIVQHSKSETSMSMSLPDDTMNENIQSPAYSDISDANDTAPVLESEVQSVKEKEDKVGKSTPDASQSPAANISAYGMYPYYSQPPYLLPSVSPQSAISGSQGQNVLDKTDSIKKLEPDRVKENRSWSNPSGETRDRPHFDHHETDKKTSREEGVQSSALTSSPAAPGIPVQEYPLPQHYPYPYSGYVQGYPYSVDSTYHMQMLESDPHYKQQYKQYLDEQHRMYKEQQQQQQQIQYQQQQHIHQQQQHSSHQSKSHHPIIKEERDKLKECKDRSSSHEKMPSGGLIVEHSSKYQHSSLMTNKEHEAREMDTRPPSLPAQARLDPSNSSSVSVSALKDRQSENHQILKENIELKSQMADSEKNKMVNQYEMAMMYERQRVDFQMQRADLQRFYMAQDRLIEQQQQKMEPGIHHHTHHHQTMQPHGHLQGLSYSSSSLKPMKDDISSHSKSNHYLDSSRSNVVSPAKSDHIKSLHSSSTSSPKGGMNRDRDSSQSSSKDYLSSSSSIRESSKKDSSSKPSSAESLDKKVDKIKIEPKSEPEGQKPTMETTGPPPPPTNSYAYLHPSYLQPPHFPHMPFEPAAHAMYRGGINPMIVSAPHYGASPYVHPQIRYVAPDMPPHPADHIAAKLHQPGSAKALDILHQVTTHKIHELQERAIMSPTPASNTPSSTPTAGSVGKISTSDSMPSKSDSGSRESTRSPPTQRHLHTHHHTHVGVGYPIPYDPYGVAVPKYS